jgi:hypothetical protein
MTMPNKNRKLPLWVALAYANIESRKLAVYLTAASLLFTACCLPIMQMFSLPGWLGKVFLADDWTWFAFSLAITIWYWLGIRWIDNHGSWPADQALQSCTASPPVPPSASSR